MSAHARPLHFVFKIGERELALKFFRQILGMKVLRHEEFKKGCEASCNGPYDGHWSKTMIGYGPEDKHFVMELTYNYGIGSYKLGNDFQGITIKSKEAIENAKKLNWPIESENDLNVVKAPGGYKFYLINESQPVDKDPVEKVTLACSNLKNSIHYWKDLCQMNLLSETDKNAVLAYGTDKCVLELKQIEGSVDRGSAFGRIAFAVPETEISEIEAKMTAEKQTILTHPVKLDTPGKATVTVVILADPDGHEICYVDNDGFADLSQFDPKGEELLDEAIKQDDSSEWFAQEGKTKPSA